MRPTHLCKGLLFVGLGLVLLRAGPARAGELGVNPVQIHLDGESASEMLKLTNSGKAEVRYEISAFAWDEPPQGGTRLTPTEDVAVFPPVLAIAPGETRNVRIGALVAAGPVERTYRIILDEIPPATRPQGVQFLSRLSIPVFVAPTAPQVATTIDAKGTARFGLRNTGTVHVRPRTVTARALDAKGAPLAEKSWPGWYVLAGGERLYAVPVPRASCAKVREIEVTVLGDDGNLHQRVATPKGVCGT